MTTSQSVGDVSYSMKRSSFQMCHTDVSYSINDTMTDGHRVID
jgi:hypothetical protein